MKVPIEFEITEQPLVTDEMGSSPQQVSPATSPTETLQQSLHAVVGGLIRQKRLLQEQVKDENEEQRRNIRGLFLKLLTVVDSLDRLIRYANPENELTNSLNAVRAEFLQLLEDYEILPISMSPGDVFDNDTCDAASRKLRPDLPEYTILSIERRGYTWKSKTLRKTRVIISVRPKGG